jgi:hypothetical protein
MIFAHVGFPWDLAESQGFFHNSDKILRWRGIGASQP